MMKPVVPHAMVISIFASIICPFGGFFASGVKRAFRIKDFGDSIPGHGGVTDRFDCHGLMGMFVFVYLTQVIYKSEFAMEKVLEYVNLMGIEEKSSLMQILANDLGLVNATGLM